ncbi:MAG: type II secretion system minor pseudopilin GspK [Kangiellaceae bacterium]|jgi:general secretion pathway protein K|nr:type II secretion system minor pseudopilin GspK [Kangiellaceae bacterium]
MNSITAKMTLPKQSGVTLLIVLVIVALVTIIATQFIEQSIYSERRTKLMLGRQQAYELALGGEMLAKKWLVQGFGNDETVHLDQPWATTPFEFPLEGGMIAATIVDAQSCFNLNSLQPIANNNQPNQPADPSNQLYQNLLSELLRDLPDSNLSDQGLLETVVDWIDADTRPSGNDGAEDQEYTGYTIPYRTANSLIANYSELRVIKGYDSNIYELLKPYVCALPDSNVRSINVNTLQSDQALLLSAANSQLSPDQAAELISSRPEGGYDANSFNEAVNELLANNPNQAPSPPSNGRNGPQQNTGTNNILSYTSDHFFVNITVDYQGASFKMKSLLKREGSGQNTTFSLISRYFGAI